MCASICYFVFFTIVEMYLNILAETSAADSQSVPLLVDTSSLALFDCF